MKFPGSAMSIALLMMASAARGADAPKANLQLTMLTKVNPQGLALWAITNNAQDDNGDVTGSKITAAQWTQLAEIGKALREGGSTLATRNGILAATPGVKLQDEAGDGSSKAADVQRFVDAKPAVFRAHALELQKVGAAVLEAATGHDAKRLDALANSLDGVCESCHMSFWYPQQQQR